MIPAVFSCLSQRMTPFARIDAIWRRRSSESQLFALITPQSNSGPQVISNPDRVSFNTALIRVERRHPVAHIARASFFRVSGSS